MNKADIANIKKVIALKKAEQFVASKGGEYTISQLKLLTIEDLQKMLDDETNKKKATLKIDIKRQVDNIFNKFGEDSDNMIVLSACYFPDHEVWQVEFPMEDIDFARDDEYNTIANPIGRYWDVKNNEKNHGKDDELFDLTRDLEKTLKKYGIGDSFYYFEDDNDALNEYWYGVVAITRDYRVVKFVIRDDGMVCNDDGTFNNMWANVIEDLGE